MNLVSVAGHARGCCDGRARKGVTTQWAHAHKAEQRVMACPAQCHRVGSALTQEVKVFKA